ncbi:MAG: ATP-grasp domain-containing protein [Sedimentisphaerales bacterium]|nr:ATP-grasp domain-containing protein [Sedimentisphaerales bacterium]
MKTQWHVTVLVDEGTISPDDPEFTGAPREPMTEYHVVEALRILGHRVSIVGVYDNLPDMIGKLQEQAPDVVFNLTEQFRGFRTFDKNIVSVLEMLQLPFTGAGSLGLLLCRDKCLCKQLLAVHRIRVPGFLALPLGKKVKIPKSIRFPMVIKPALEDGSDGISNASLVWDEQALRERVEYVHDRWEQHAIAEEYVQGRELYVTLLGNKRLTVFPFREFFHANDIGGPSMATSQVKWNPEYRKKWGIKFGFAEVDSDLAESIARVCKKVYRILHLRDYGRIDLRVTPEGKMAILEANPNPDLAYGEEVAESAERGGVSYEDLIHRILRQAMQRRA